MLRNCYRICYSLPTKFALGLAGICLALTISVPARAVTELYRVILTESPATSALIGWNLVGGCPDTQRVYYDTEDHGQDTAAYAFSARISASYFHQSMENYFCHLKDLQPGTRYYFVIAEDQGISPRLGFSTFSEDMHPWQAYWTSPSLSSSPERWKRFCRQLPDRPANFVLIEGLTQLQTESSWRQWLENWQLSIGEDGQMIPLLIGGSPTPDIQYFFNYPAATVRAYPLAGETLLVTTPGQKMPKKRFWKKLPPSDFILLHSPLAPQSVPASANLLLTIDSLKNADLTNAFKFPGKFSFVELSWREKVLQIESPEQEKLVEAY